MIKLGTVITTNGNVVNIDSKYEVRYSTKLEKNEVNKGFFNKLVDEFAVEHKENLEEHIRDLVGINDELLDQFYKLRITDNKQERDSIISKIVNKLYEESFVEQHVIKQ